MKENYNTNNHNKNFNNKRNDLSIVELLFFSIFCFHITDLFMQSKTFSEKFSIRFANIRV
jgi:hypothetical protein